MKLNPLPDLLIIEFTFIEIGLFYGGKQLEADCRFLNFLTRSFQDGKFW